MQIFRKSNDWGEARAKKTKENRKKAEVEKNQSAADAEAKLELKRKELEIMMAELQKETVAKETLSLNIRKDIDTTNLREQIAIKGEERNQAREETAKSTTHQLRFR